MMSRITRLSAGFSVRAAFLLLAVSCQAFPSASFQPEGNAGSVGMTQANAELSGKVTASGEALLGKKYGTPNVIVAGRKFTLESRKGQLEY